MNPITVIRKNDYTLTVDTSNVQGTIQFSVKRLSQTDQPDDVALVVKDPVAVTGSTTTIELTATDTNIPSGKYFYDFLIVDNGLRANTKKGVFEVKEGVTQGE